MFEGAAIGAAVAVGLTVVLQVFMTIQGRESVFPTLAMIGLGTGLGAALSLHRRLTDANIAALLDRPLWICAHDS